jgi:hypothetical protein
MDIADEDIGLAIEALYMMKFNTQMCDSNLSQYNLLNDIEHCIGVFQEFREEERKKRIEDLRSVYNSE